MVLRAVESRGREERRGRERESRDEERRNIANGSAVSKFKEGACTNVGGTVRSPNRGLGFVDLVAGSHHSLLSSASLLQASSADILDISLVRTGWYKWRRVAAASVTGAVHTEIKMEALGLPFPANHVLCSFWRRHASDSRIVHSHSPRFLSHVCSLFPARSYCFVFSSVYNPCHRAI